LAILNRAGRRDFNAGNSAGRSLSFLEDPTLNRDTEKIARPLRRIAEK
jgi:hypothetical protein